MPKSRNNSRKSTASSKGAPKVEVDEEGYPSVVMRHTPPSSKKTTPKMPRPEFLEPSAPIPLTPPPPPPSPWETLGMSQGDYSAMIQRVFSRYEEMNKITLQKSLLDDVDDPLFWLVRIEKLEREREYFNKKRGWSAPELARVEQIDLEIEECEMELERIDNMEDQLEYEWD